MDHTTGEGANVAQEAEGRRRNWFARLYRWANHRLYDEFAWAYDVVSWLVSLGHWDGWRRQALSYVTGGRILEVGFGTGELLIAAAERGWQVSGLDLSPAMQRITAGKMRRRGIWAPRVRGRAQGMPFVDGCFDAIIATFPAEYILDPATLREVARLLRPPEPEKDAPGGRFIIAGASFRTENALLGGALRLVFGGATEDSLARYRRAVAADFQVTVIDEKGKWVSMPVLILERRATR